MQAIYYEKYGSPDVLTLKEVDKPVPKSNEVLVQVHSASINSWDWDMIRGKPYIVRMWGLTKPRYRIPGADVAGIVESVGKNVTLFKPGDEVLGDLCECGWGGFAEFVCAKENAFSKKPHGISFSEAASLPQAGMLAFQGINYNGEVKPSQQVLINGACGGVGTLALQLLKLKGAVVTCVDLNEKHELLTQLGADHLIDYTHIDFTTTGKKYDLVLDVILNRPIGTCMRALTDNGKYVVIGGSIAILFQVALVGRKVKLLALKPNFGLDKLVTLVDEGKVKPVIDQLFPLERTVDAFRYFATGKVKGKVIIIMKE